MESVRLCPAKESQVRVTSSSQGRFAAAKFGALQTQRFKLNRWVCANGSYWPSLHGVLRCSLPHDVAETLARYLAILPQLRLGRIAVLL